MKKLLTTLLLSVPLMSFAQEAGFKLDTSLLCHKTEKVGQMVKEYDEKDAFIGLDQVYTQNALVAVFLNKTTGTYTITITDIKSNATCILSAGKNGQFLISDKK